MSVDPKSFSNNAKAENEKTNPQNEISTPTLSLQALNEFNLRLLNKLGPSQRNNTSDNEVQNPPTTSNLQPFITDEEE